MYPIIYGTSIYTDIHFAPSVKLEHFEKKRDAEYISIAYTIYRRQRVVIEAQNPMSILFIYSLNIFIFRVFI